MAFNPFIGWKVEELELALRDAQEELASGTTATRVGAGDVSTDSRVDRSPESRIELLYKALNLLYPDKYPLSQLVRADRARIRFDTSQWADNTAFS